MDALSLFAGFGCGFLVGLIVTVAAVAELLDGECMDQSVCEKRRAEEGRSR